MTVLRFTFAVFSAIVGLSGFICFAVLKNYPAAIFGALTGMVNGLLCHVHLLNIKNKLHEWYAPTNFSEMARFGFSVFTFSTMCLVYFSVIEIMLKKPILPIPESAVIPLVWSFLGLKSGLLLLYYARSYTPRENQLLAEY